MGKIATKVKLVAGVRFNVSNGETVDVDVTTFPEDIQTKLAIHGLSQKLGDSYASASDKGMSIQDCVDGVNEIVRSMAAGNWSATGSSGVSIMAEAIAVLLDKDIRQCADLIQGMTADERGAMSKRPDVKAEVARIKAARARAKLDTTPGGDDIDTLLDMFR